MRKLKQAKRVTGQAHMQLSVEDAKAQQWHQEDYLNALVFIQTSKGQDMIQQHKQQETLKSTYLYLDLMSSFYQVFFRQVLGSSEVGGRYLVWQMQG